MLFSDWICDCNGASVVLVAEIACEGLLAKKAASDCNCELAGTKALRFINASVCDLITFAS